MPSFSDEYPDASSLLVLEPEELAGFVLQHLAAEQSRGKRLNRRSFSQSPTVSRYAPADRGPILQALMEAWVWLEREGMIAPYPGDTADWVFVTRRGQRAAEPHLLAAYRHTDLLPHNQLHPRIAAQVYPSFLRGDYETAVFLAFKEVEVAVREAAEAAAQEIGVKLMRSAFAPGRGRLSDTEALDAEQKGVADLFAGAIGTFKNPGSHRRVVIDPIATAEAIVFASSLLRIVDARLSSCR